MKQKWTRRELNPLLIHAMDVCYRYTTGPSVDDVGIEPTTSSMSTKRSTTELVVHSYEVYFSEKDEYYPADLCK